MSGERVSTMPRTDYYEADFPVLTRDSDCFSQCQAASLLSFLQETGLSSLSELGLTRTYLLERYNAVWMLARVRYNLTGPIRLGDVITVRAWCREAHGMALYRDYTILRDGVQIGEALALWMLVDAKARTLLPVSSVPDFCDLVKHPPAKKQQLGRLDLPEGLESVVFRTVEYSQADMNGHLNNSRYADLICDTIRMAEWNGAYISELQISYLSECMPGCVLEMSMLQQGDTRYIRGTGDDGVVRFEARAVLRCP